MLDSIADAMHVAGLTTDTLNYTIYRYVTDAHVVLDLTNNRSA